MYYITHVCTYVCVPEDNPKCLSLSGAVTLFRFVEADPLHCPQTCQVAKAGQATSETCHLHLPRAETANAHTTLAFPFNPFTHSWDCPSAHGLSGTYLSRACECNLVYANVRRYCCPCCWPIPWQNVDDPGWKASLGNTNGKKVYVYRPSGWLCSASQVPHKGGEEPLESVYSYLLDEGSHIQCTEWCLLCRLDDHSVTTAQCRGDFPGEHQQGEIPLEGKSKVNREGKCFSIAYFCLLRF